MDALALAFKKIVETLQSSLIRVERPCLFAPTALVVDRLPAVGQNDFACGCC